MIQSSEKFVTSSFYGSIAEGVAIIAEDIYQEA